MPVFLPSDGKKARKQRRALKPTKADTRARRNYYAALADQVKFLQAQTANLSDLLASGAQRAAVAQRLAAMTAEARERAALYAPQIAARFVGEVDTGQKAALESSIAKALGVDFARIVDDPQTAADLALSLDANTALIRSISDEHLAKVGQAVMANYRGQALPGGLSLMDHLKTLGAQTDNRARLIARDQTNKLTGDLNASRQQHNGIEEYTWHTSRGSRVVGNPGGLYPQGNSAHGDHWHREGKLFRWDEPPEDGHPGQAILCRCWAAPVLDLEKLKALWT